MDFNRGYLRGIGQQSRVIEEKSPGQMAFDTDRLDEVDLVRKSSIAVGVEYTEGLEGNLHQLLYRDARNRAGICGWCGLGPRQIGRASCRERV